MAIVSGHGKHCVKEITLYNVKIETAEHVIPDVELVIRHVNATHIKVSFSTHLHEEISGNGKVRI